MATATGKPIDAVVELDGQPIPAADRGASVHEDANGRTVVTVRASDMYRIVRSAGRRRPRAQRRRTAAPVSRRMPSRSASRMAPIAGDVTVIAQIIALFGAGVASFLAPCIVPLVPAYLGIIVGEIGDAHDPARAPCRRR